MNKKIMFETNGENRYLVYEADKEADLDELGLGMLVNNRIDRKSTRLNSSH